MDKTSWVYSSYVWQGDRRRRTGPEEANLTSEVVHLWSFAPEVHIDGVNPFICKLNDRHLILNVQEVLSIFT